MCLSEVDKIYKRIRKGEHIGYKVMGKSGKKGFYKGNIINPSILREAGRWLKEEDFRRGSRGYIKCPIGWCIWRSKEEAKVYTSFWQTHKDVIVKVKYRKVVARGKQTNISCFCNNFITTEVIVAKEIYIIGEVK